MFAAHLMKMAGIWLSLTAESIGRHVLRKFSLFRAWVLAVNHISVLVHKKKWSEKEEDFCDLIVKGKPPAQQSPPHFVTTHNLPHSGPRPLGLGRRIKFTPEISPSICSSPHR